MLTAKWITRPEWRGSDQSNRIVSTADSCFSVDGVEYWIPKGYEIDGASVPFLLWAIAGTPFEPDNAEPAFAHDAGYLTHAFSRKDCDEILYQLKLAHELMIKTKPWRAKYRAWKMWAGVRMAGFWAYKNSESDIVELTKIRKIIQEIPDPNFEKFLTLWFSEGKV
jgi:hypothetical protein